MKAIPSITIAHLRKNYRTSLAVMMAVLLSSTLLCSFCIFGFAFWQTSVENTMQSRGNWHGELYQNTPGEKLAYIEQNPAVEAVMVKGAWQVARLPASCAMPYIFFRDSNEAYWHSMSEQYMLLAGRLPENTGEIAVSKLFFERNPQFSLGDTLSVPVGERTLDGEPLSAQSIEQEGEAFRQTELRELVLVGELDVTTTTAYPGYYALGYLEREEIQPDDALTVYLRFSNMRNTYKILPEIAEAVGLDKNEFGEYSILYNDDLLSHYGVRDGRAAFSLRSMTNGFAVGIVVVLLVMSFSFMIGSVFSLSANVRIRQLGMLRSMGATPRQIRKSILLEGLLLSAIPLALSVFLGYLFSQIMNDVLRGISSDLLDYNLEIRFNPAVALLGVLVSLAAVMVAVLSTAHKMQKMTPIQALRGATTSRVSKKKGKRHLFVSKTFGYPGVLALHSLSSYRKTFRMPVASLCLSFVLVGGTMGIVSVIDADNKVQSAQDYYDASVTLYFSLERDDALVDALQQTPGTIESAVLSQIGFGLQVSNDMESDAFAAEGGFAAVDANVGAVSKDGEGWRINGSLIGMDESSFIRYCEAIGENPADYLGRSEPVAIAVNRIYPSPNARASEERAKTIPFLNIAGTSLDLEEKTFDEPVDRGIAMPVAIGAVTESLPELDQIFTNYHLILVTPMEQYDAIVDGFSPERAHLYSRTTIKFVTGIEGSAFEDILTTHCASYLGSEDYEVSSREGQLLRQATGQRNVQAVVYGIAALFALIGIFNAFSAVTGNLKMRRVEFAMLRSVGLDDKGFARLLFIEGLFFSLRPILLALPFIAASTGFFVWLLDLPISILMANYAYGYIFTYAVVIMLAMGLAYVFGSKNIRREPIALVLRSGLV